MEQLAILLKAINIYAHNAHNLCKGSLFFADHAFLNELYDQADEQYDNVVERMIGLGLPIDLVKINASAVEALKTYPANPPENKVYFQTILTMQKDLCTMIEQLVKSPGMYEGTKQMIGNIADQTEANKYKLQRRVM